MLAFWSNHLGPRKGFWKGFPIFLFKSSFAFFYTIGLQIKMSAFLYYFWAISMTVVFCDKMTVVFFFATGAPFSKVVKKNGYNSKSPLKQTMQKIMSHWLQKKQLVATKENLELLLSSLMAFQKSPICLFNCCPNELSSSFSLQCWITFILISSYKLAAASSHQYNNTNTNALWQVKYQSFLLLKAIPCSSLPTNCENKDNFKNKVTTSTAKIA